MHRAIFRICLCIALLAHSANGEVSPLEKVRPFLKQHCYECHGEKKQKNNLRFDTLGVELSKKETLEIWQGIVDQLNLGAMPPEEKPQPAPAESAQVIESVSAQLKIAYAQFKSTGGRTVMRRLNRFEIRSTLRDLLYLEDLNDYRADMVPKLEDRNGSGVTSWNTDDPTREFPADELEEGFDNIGGRLVMSDFLLKQMIGAADYSLNLATFSREKPKIQTRRYTPPIHKSDRKGNWGHWSRQVDPSFDGIYERYREPGAASGDLGRITADELTRAGVGVPGRYRIVIEASAHNQKHPWGDLIKSRQDEPMLLGLHIADARTGGISDGNPNQRMLTQWEMTADGQKRTYTFETWLAATWLPWIGWENAPHPRGLRPSQLVEKHLPQAYQPQPKNDAPQKEREEYEPRMARALFEAGYKGPHVRIHSLTVEPLIESWPPRSHVTLYGEKGDEPVDQLLLRFAARAYRSPVKPEQIARHVQLVETQRKEGRSRDEALRSGYTAIMVSPRFYYLHEPQGKLNDYELASRLSYFLWSSMPDEKLLELAAAGAINDPLVLRGQVERMLDDPKSLAFIRRFPERWLRLYKLGTMPPPGGFYHHRQMETQMRLQVDAFFGHLVKTNGPIRHIIDSDYTFLNERMAQWIYDRDDVWGDGYRKVPAKPPHGGGLLTLPAAMTATANGVDTSPVVRGVWILESVLGTPPSPPPPDVEPLSPDLRGAKTIREQLELHRKVETCNSCHRKIDPMGFAMENFDPVGKWRTVYPESRQKIDPASTLIGGRKLDDIHAFKKWLLEQETQVTRHLVSSLLTYATGRPMEATDRGAVDAIVEKLAATRGGMRDLIHLVAQCETFRTK